MTDHENRIGKPYGKRGPRSPEVKKKLSDRMKEINRKTGILTRRGDWLAKTRSARR